MKKIFLSICIIGIIVLNFSSGNNNILSSNLNLNTLMNTAFADTEGTPHGTWPNCEGLATFGPNGGSWQKGIQEEDMEEHTEYFELRYDGKFSIGFFLNKALAEASTEYEVEAGVQKKWSVAYTCDDSNTDCCAQNNRYYL